MTPLDETTARLEELLERAADGPWFVCSMPTDSGLSVIEDGRIDGLFPITGEAHEIALIVEAVNALPALLSELRAFKDEVERLREALRTCAVQFRFYEQQHLSKGTADGNDKAKTNADFALMAETALTSNGGGTLLAAKEQATL